jgi:hypothetical protein
MMTRLASALGILVSSLTFGAPALASPVQVFGGIEGFSGVVGSDAQFVTYFDQGSGPMVICPDAGCGTGIGAANLDDNVLGTARLEFWNTDFGVERTHHVIAFEWADPQDVELGEEFLMGTITFTNGIWFSDPRSASSSVRPRPILPWMRTCWPTRCGSPSPPTR